MKRSLALIFCVTLFAICVFAAIKDRAAGSDVLNPRLVPTPSLAPEVARPRLNFPKQIIQATQQGLILAPETSLRSMAEQLREVRKQKADLEKQERTIVKGIHDKIELELREIEELKKEIRGSQPQRVGGEK